MESALTAGLLRFASEIRLAESAGRRLKPLSGLGFSDTELAVDIAKCQLTGVNMLPLDIAVEMP
jgi:hypothetical protein